MPRIPSSKIDDIKQSVSLVRLVEAKGIALKKHGKDYIGHCPFHNDKTPSFVVSPKNNLWNCLGACGMGGSVIDFMMKLDGLSFRHAVEVLTNSELPVSSLAANEVKNKTAAKPPKVVKECTTTQLSNPLTPDIDNQTALSQVVDYYHQALKNTPEAMDYLTNQRGQSKLILSKWLILGTK